MPEGMVAFQLGHRCQDSGTGKYDKSSLEVILILIFGHLYLNLINGRDPLLIVLSLGKFNVLIVWESPKTSPISLVVIGTAVSPFKSMWQYAIFILFISHIDSGIWSWLHPNWRRPLNLSSLITYFYLSERCPTPLRNWWPEHHDLISIWNTLERS